MNVIKNELLVKKIILLISFIIITANTYLILSNTSIYSQIQNIAETGLYPYVVLLLCIIFFITRSNIKESYKISKNQEIERVYFILGSVLIFLSVLMPKNVDLPYIVFEIILGYLGICFLVIGKFAIFPTYLLSIYGFSIAFPEFAEQHPSESFLQLITWITVKISSIFIPVNFSNYSIRIFSLTEENILIIINTACTGVAALALFIAIFALMMADIPLPKKDAAFFFIFGIIGTFVQNIVRLVVLVLTGYYFGSQALSNAHEVIGYIMFGLYYMLFAYLYLRKARHYRIARQSIQLQQP
ncbi:MAG: exosortase/archaeosortase family protein [Bacteroidales bacterium]|nr:exosortase/archaeosortase family protein [Bacteroidales bacterium]